MQKISSTVDRDLAWADDRGWEHRTIQVWIKLNAEAESMPASWHAGGETLYYDFGAGRDPGIAATYEISQLACGMPTSKDQATTFKSVPEMAFIDADP